MKYLFLLFLFFSFEAKAHIEFQSCLLVDRYFDSKSSLMIHKKVIIGIAHQKIAAIVSATEAVKCRKKIVLIGKTVLPGLIDVHAHLLLLDRQLGLDGTEEILRNVKLGVPARLERARERAKSYLISGFTTIRELGNSGLFGDLELKQKVDLEEFVGPRIVPSGPGISTMPGQLPEGTDRETVELEYKTISRTEDVESLILSYKEKGAEVIKVFADNLPSSGTMDEKLLREVVVQSHKLKLKVAAHCATDESAKAASGAKVDSLEHGYGISEESMQAMVANNIFFVPTHLSRDLLSAITEHLRPNHSDNKKVIEENLARQSQTIQSAMRAGVKIAAGSDMYFYLDDLGFSQGEASKQVLFSYHQSGMTPEKVLSSATYSAASLLGKEGEVGEIKVGASADIIALSGDPFADLGELKNVSFVMKSGKVIK